MKNGLTTIEDARMRFKRDYDICHTLTKLELKCWINHSESRHRNNNPPFTFNNYIRHMGIREVLEQVELDMINCDDLGGKDTIIEFLKKYL